MATGHTPFITCPSYLNGFDGCLDIWTISLLLCGKSWGRGWVVLQITFQPLFNSSHATKYAIPFLKYTDSECMVMVVNTTHTPARTLLNLHSGSLWSAPVWLPRGLVGGTLCTIMPGTSPSDRCRYDNWREQEWANLLSRRILASILASIKPSAGTCRAVYTCDYK